jgi:hypothetical protein
VACLMILEVSQRTTGFACARIWVAAVRGNPGVGARRMKGISGHSPTVPSGRAARGMTPTLAGTTGADP